MLTTLCLVSPLCAEELNIAKADLHPYVDHTKGREGFRFTDRPVNEFRVYDFYQRQADYYMSRKAKVPAVLPSYPGLDGGMHGHWGKNNQNNHQDDRWNKMGHYGFIGQNIDEVAPDGHSINADHQQQMHTAFSAQTNLSFFRYWEGEFVYFHPYRWGTSNGLKPKGKMLAQFNKVKVGNTRKEKSSGSKSVGWQIEKKDQQYIGLIDSDIGPIYSYKIKGTSMLDTVTSQAGKVFHRVIEAQGGLKASRLALFDCHKSGMKEVTAGVWSVKSADGKVTLYICLAQKGGQAKLLVKEGMLTLEVTNLTQGQQCNILFGENLDAVKKAKVKVSTGSLKLVELALKRQKKWHKTYTVAGTLAANDKAYVVDDIPVPFGNSNKSLMFLTDIVFDKVGTAFVTTLMGEVWQVKGLGSDLKKVTWRRVAAGLNQPFGLKLWDDKLHVLERDQITVLEDRNKDGEMDFYGNFSNLVSGLSGSHTHTWGMAKDKDGYIHFVAAWNSYRISPDGKKIETMTKGLRNCMGFGHLSDGTILVGPQEGTNTPTSEIIEVRKGDNHGFKNNDKLSIPLGYVPRGVDNSTGGFLEVDSKRWGPLGNKGVLGISYGYGAWYQILFDRNVSKTGHRQVASVPMDGNFSSGVTRGAVNPVDGQVYMVGLDGWGDYSVQDGCLHRLRYTGKPLLEPIGYEVCDNGIKIEFSEALDANYINDASRYFAQMWNYNNSRQYGSPEFSIKNPKSLGHDSLKVRSARVLGGGKSIFVEIPELQPAMQMHLRMHLKTKSGLEFKSDLFPTIVKLGEFYKFDGAIAKVDKSRDFLLRTDRESGKKQSLFTSSGREDAHAKKVKIQTVMSLKYNVKKFTVKAGESVALELKNVDTMPHNLVIVNPAMKKLVGEAAFKMLNDPEALKKSYVPDDKSVRSNVVAFTYVVDPKGAHTTYFIAPKEKGEYPFICTFPGHWQAMQGVMIVE